MASLSFEEILGQVYLTGVIQETTTGIPDVLPPAFTSLKTRTIGREGRYTVVQGTRRTAKTTGYGAPARKRELKDIASKDVKLVHTFEMIEMDPLLLQRLRGYQSYDFQQMGIDEVNRQQAEFRVYFDNLRLAATYSMLALGHVYFDSDGNLLPTSSGNLLDIDYQINANNQNQLNGIITASWAAANTDIPAQLRALQNRSLQQSGRPLKHAFYGVNVPSYITQNNYILDYLARTPAMAQKFLDTAEIPDGLFNLTWHPVHAAFYEDKDGTNQTFFGDDTVVFTPEIDNTVYECMEGTYMVPTTFNATADLVGALRSLTQVQGMFSYGMPTHNPVGVSTFAGDTFLPIWKIPDALYIGDVTP